MFKYRLLSAVFLVIVAVITVFKGGVLLAGVLGGISLVAFRELCLACRVLPYHSETDKANGTRDYTYNKDNGEAFIMKKGFGEHNAMEITGYVFIVLYYLAMGILRQPLYMILAVLLCLVIFLIVYVFSFPKIHASQLMSTYFSFIYAPVMFSFLYMTRELEFGIYFVWMIFISSWISDTCAYCVGMLLGRHKLAPVLSPKKSIEGAVGGVLGSVIVGALFGYFIVEGIITDKEVTWAFALIGGIGSIVSQIGDLAASAIKRNYDIKDYGKLIPGHGGIMDRFDSIIVTAPMIYFLFTIFV